jgi:hypothetical protein
VGSSTHTYLTNVLDPTILPLHEIARLYARRWDIEMRQPHYPHRTDPLFAGAWFGLLSFLILPRGRCRLERRAVRPAIARFVAQ